MIRILFFIFFLFPSLGMTKLYCDKFWEILKTNENIEVNEAPYFEIPTFKFDVKQKPYEIIADFISDDYISDNFPNIHPRVWQNWMAGIHFPERKDLEFCKNYECSKELSSFLKKEEYLILNQILFRHLDDTYFRDNSNIFDQKNWEDSSTLEKEESFFPELNKTFISHIDNIKISEYSDEELFKLLYLPDGKEKIFRFQITAYVSKNNEYIPLDLIGYIDLKIEPSLTKITPLNYEIYIHEYPEIDTLENTLKIKYNLTNLTYSNPLKLVFEQALKQSGYDFLTDIDFIDSIEKDELHLADDLTCSISLERYKNENFQFWISRPDIKYFSNTDVEDKDIKFQFVYHAGGYAPVYMITSIDKKSKTIRNRFDLHTFPFDRQKFELRISDLFYTTPSDINPYISYLSDKNLALYIEIDNEELDYRNRTFYDDYNTIDFKLADISQNIEYGYASELNVVPEWVIQLEYERVPNYYFYKIFLPVFVLVLLSLSSFIIPKKELESKLTLTVVIFLALIAYIFVIDDNIPKLSYMTVLDYYVLTAFIFTSIPIIFSIFVYKADGIVGAKNKIFKFFPVAITSTFFISVYLIFSYHSRIFENASGFLKNFI